MSNTQDAERRFARNLFSGSDDDQGLDDDNQGKRTDRTDDGLDEQRRFAADLFAPDDPDASILAGLTDGRTVGKWQHPEPEPQDRGPWFDRRPATDD